jgi:excisionase family DNA binding protein
VTPLALPLAPEALDVIAERVADLLAQRAAEPSPWMTAEQAATYLAAPVSRIRKLTMTGELPHAKDGRRVLYRREELDAFIRNGGARTP